MYYIYIDGATLKNVSSVCLVVREKKQMDL